MSISSPTKVLLVEDFEPFRALIKSLIKDVAGLQIIGETSDGLEAIAMTQELRPDLILMDIGLPKLNGIECAQRIRTFLADSKIVFVTQETSIDVLEGALSLGACGYVLKSQVGSELLAAIEAVLQGKQYISKGLPR
jgi:DNA-binding NarL/FixJ family response regulator